VGQGVEIGPRETGDMDMSAERIRSSEKKETVIDIDPPHLQTLLLFECRLTQQTPLLPPQPSGTISIRPPTASSHL